MWAIRRASIQSRNKGLLSSSGRIFCGETVFAKCCSETCNAANIASQETIFDGLLSCTRFYSKSSGFSREVRTFWSQVGDKSSGEVSEDEFSELETPQDTVEEAASGNENDDDLSSGSELSEDEGNADDALNESEMPGSKTDWKDKLPPSAMCKALLSAPDLPTSKVLDKWVEEGNEVTESEIRSAMENLRKRRLFVKALQLSEWLESRKHVELVESTRYLRVDLIAKVQGLFKAENYVNQLPESSRTEKVYRTLLANCVSASNLKKAEELFNKMKDLGFPITCYACNKMMLIYKKTDRKKIADVLLLMEKEDIKPSVLSYKILIDWKGQSNDIDGVEQLLEKMEAEGLKPTTHIQASVARYYVCAGLKDKAEAVLTEIEGGDLEKKRGACRLLIPIYASLGRAEDVERIWKVCESDPGLGECLIVIEAWGQLKKIENAEAVFDIFSKKVKKPSVRLYTTLLRVYAKHKMLNKGKELVNQMVASGFNLGPPTLDALVKFYIRAGEVEKADSILGKAIKRRIGKPFFTSYMAIMEKYAERGDVHNAEKMFRMMKEGGYILHLRQYQTLLNAYVHAKEPAYGFLDRMKADGITPSKWMSGHLASIDASRKSPVSDLLECVMKVEVILLSWIICYCCLIAILLSYF